MRTHDHTTVLAYGGGRQTVAICILIKMGILPKPDIAVIADTGRENPMTWEYLDQYVQPMMTELGCPVHRAPHDLATVDLRGKNGQLLIPLYTDTGKRKTYCSNEWKRRVLDRYLRNMGMRRGTRWIGLAWEERRRWTRLHEKTEHGWKTTCPLVTLCITTEMALDIIKQHGWPTPHPSHCWMCPQQTTAQWEYLRTNRPEYFDQAMALDEALRDELDDHTQYLHRARVPLSSLPIVSQTENDATGDCDSGNCFT